ncbi:RabGAP/TBC domain-containing protein, variant [Capsaspora owczarzaki ATCC 30864]|uniref:RabGAP/TBC domain-containing protein, variant n=1 Tax=Capsaspora owczarzaki (strain ATCC 30864) TaxID=595528 RepID=A0A0D2WNW4_CAPO3|nr:RabGAP/TBC domain-containing protein, variant [Capsaspora owczarzaki ATCC 30864]
MSSSSPRPPPPSNGLSSSGSTSSTSSTASNSTTTTTTTSSSSTQAGGRPVSLTTLLGLFTHNNNASNSSSAQPQPTPPHQHEHSTSSANSVSSGSSDSASNGAAAATGHGDDNSAQGRSSGNAILSPASVQAKLGKVKRAFSTLVKRTDSPSTSPTGAAAAAGDTHTTGNSHSPVTILPNGTQITLAPRPGNLPVKDKAEEDRQRRQFEVILDNVKRKEDQENRRNEKKDKQVGDLITRWTTEVLPNWKHQMRTSRKAVEELVWHGIPPNVRGKVWLLAAGNDLHITPDLYHIFLTHARNKLRATNDEEGGWEVNEDATAAAAAATANGSGSAILHNSLSREQSVHLISLDVSRTFPHLCIFQKGGPYYDSLRSVLEAYVCYRPDVGYVQGMSFLASMLLLNVDVVDAFICLANLLNRPVHLGFYRMDTNVVSVFV